MLRKRLASPATSGAMLGRKESGASLDTTPADQFVRLTAPKAANPPQLCHMPMLAKIVVFTS